MPTGVADFRGERYAFRQNTTSRLRHFAKGVLCDLDPLDSTRGLQMIADGTFRQKGSAVGGVEVFWNSFGSPGLSSDRAIRTRFAEFLEGLATGAATRAHWDAFVVEHYRDDTVEEIRRDCVRLFRAEDEHWLKRIRTNAEAAQLLNWAASLRSAEHSSAADRGPN